MEIGLDFDGVIANTPALKSQRAKELFGLDIDPQDFLAPHVLQKKLISEEQYKTLRDTMYSDPNVYMMVEPLPGAVEYIQKLVNDGHSLQVITARLGNEDETKRKWLEKHGIPLFVVGVDINESKARASYGVDVYMDDSLLKLYEVKDIVPHRFIYSWGYNKIYKEDGVAKRISSWEEFYNEVSKLV